MLGSHLTSLLNCGISTAGIDRRRAESGLAANVGSDAPQPPHLYTGKRKLRLGQHVAPAAVPHDLRESRERVAHYNWTLYPRPGCLERPEMASPRTQNPAELRGAPTGATPHAGYRERPLYPHRSNRNEHVTNRDN